MTGAVAPPLPLGPFDLAYADPGLFWRGSSSNGEGRSPQKHYRCEDEETICRLPEVDIMAPNSVLAIWPYGPRLTDKPWIISAWEFIFTSIAFVWVKVDKLGKPLNQAEPDGGRHSDLSTPIHQKTDRLVGTARELSFPK